MVSGEASRAIALGAMNKNAPSWKLVIVVASAICCSRLLKNADEDELMI
jgi:hypothetical protein